jgi:hypothetical protein
VSDCDAFADGFILLSYSTLYAKVTCVSGAGGGTAPSATRDPCG